MSWDHNNTFSVKIYIFNSNYHSPVGEQYWNLYDNLNIACLKKIILHKEFNFYITWNWRISSEYFTTLLGDIIQNIIWLFHRKYYSISLNHCLWFRYFWFISPDQVPHRELVNVVCILLNLLRYPTNQSPKCIIYRPMN